MLELRHADELYALSDTNRDHLREWLPWVDGTTSVQQTRDFISMSLNEYANNVGMNLGIFYNDSLIGCIGVHSIDWCNHKTSIGYWLDRRYQGKGIMTKACAELLDYLFGELSLNRIEIRAAVENARSRAIPERLGFTLEGQIRDAEWIEDHFVDHVVYGLLKQEWMGKKGRNLNEQ